MPDRRKFRGPSHKCVSVSAEAPSTRNNVMDAHMFLRARVSKVTLGDSDFHRDRYARLKEY